ncbi:NAD-dependent epimerase/dehydratase family protein [Serratia silvae]|uniref:NAD-dependent epimerase/dehydratase family protein n=1 Tax=Serratia silvae TaxID=2824122 RepID=A0ABT0KG73_9GAMM|nr:NAD-dependent epimerase/dehydratase family protein [Serratia silvae]MCL1031034.1 NAD-dependent epimerase/dehydratase family protein [Serratia silvae]
MDKRKIAIIGGSGFIGSRLVKRLSARRDLAVKIIDVEQSQRFPQWYQYADVTQPESLRQALAGCDAVINLADKRQGAVRSTSLYYQINVEGARNLCMVAAELTIKQIIFTSSVAVYGDVEQETDEEGHFAPCSHYGKSKLEAEYVYEAWRNDSDGNRLTIIRPAVVFGEGDRGNVYKLFRRIAKSRLVMIGDGRNRRSMAYVENIAARLEYALDQQADYQVSNYADKPDLSMNQLIGVVTNVLGREDKLIHIPYLPGIWGIALLDLVGKISRYRFSISRAKVQKFCATAQFKSNVEHNFVAPVDLNQAIEKTVKHEFD